MDDTLWRLFNEFKFKECYLQRYCTHCKKWNDRITFGGLLVSSASIALWFTAHLPALWSILIFGAQILQIVKPFFSYEKHMDAFKYLIPEVSCLTIDLENTWRKNRYASADELSDLLRQYRDRYNSSERKYLGISDIPRIDKVNSDATMDAQAFFSVHYNTDWSDTNVSKAPISTTTSADTQTDTRTYATTNTWQNRTRECAWP